MPAQGSSPLPVEASKQPTPSNDTGFAESLLDVKRRGKELALLYRDAQNRAAGRLPHIGALMDAEEEILTSLQRVRHLSPLILVDGAPAVGKSSLINGLLCSVDGTAAGGKSEDSKDDDAWEVVDAAPTEDVAPPVVERPPFIKPIITRGGGGLQPRRPLVVRAPTVAHSVAQRYLEGRPSLHRSERSEAMLRLLTEEEWHDVCQGGGSSGIAGSEGAEDPSSSTQSMPLILEDSRATPAWSSGVWLTEVDTDDAECVRWSWVRECCDVVLLLRADPAGQLQPEDGARARRHMGSGHRVFLVVIVSGDESFPAEAAPGAESAQPSDAPAREIMDNIRTCLRSSEDDDSGSLECLQGVHVMTFRSGTCLDADTPGRFSLAGEPGQEAWTTCVQALRRFSVDAERAKLVAASEGFSAAQGAFLRWCSQGAKVVSAASSRFRHDADDVRLARDLITRNIDAAYLAHVFSSVLIGKFDTLCAQIAASPSPDLGNHWGRHATQRVMEEHLKKTLEAGLRDAISASLAEVTAEMAKQELPALHEIQRVARRGSDVPWDAEVKQLECDMSHDKLQGFAMQFFGSLGVGVLSGLGAAALEALLGELALGPVGLVAGVATFAIIGVQTADWPSIRSEFVRRVRSQQLELVAKAKAQLNFPGLCERRKRRILEKMDLVLCRLMAEVAALSEAASEFARCSLVLQDKSSSAPAPVSVKST